MTLNGNGGRIWRWQKKDILFVFGLAGLVWFAITRDPIVAVVSGGLVGIPLAQRGDKP